MQHKKPMIEKEPVYDEIGRRIRGRHSCPPFNKLNPTEEEMDEYMREEE